jgi:hypothetical protein
MTEVNTVIISIELYDSLKEKEKEMELFKFQNSCELIRINYDGYAGKAKYYYTGKDEVIKDLIATNERINTYITHLVTERKTSLDVQRSFSQMTPKQRKHFIKTGEVRQ